MEHYCWLKWINSPWIFPPVSKTKTQNIWNYGFWDIAIKPMKVGDFRKMKNKGDNQCDCRALLSWERLQALTRGVQTKKSMTVPWVMQQRTPVKTKLARVHRMSYGLEENQTERELEINMGVFAQWCLTLCSPMDYRMTGFPVLHHLPEFAQSHVCWAGDAIQPSHPLSSSSPPAFNLSKHQGLFQWVDSLHQVAKVLGLQLQHQFF